MTCPEIYHLYLERKSEQEIHQAYREVNIADHDETNEGFTPLHLACRFADLEAVYLLLERGADVNAKDNRGETPICTLGRCRLENVNENDLEEAVKILISSGAKIHRSGQETNALIEAVRNRHFAMAEAIISSGVKINSINKNGENVLHLACQEAWFISLDREKSANRLKRMRDEGWHPDIKITEAENELARFQEQETEVFRLVKSVLANGTIDPEEKSDAGKRPVDIAMERGILAISALLTGNDPEHDELAALSGGMDVFQALIYKNKTALETILRMGTDLQRVYEGDLKTSFKGRSPLACALICSDFMSAEMILKAGASIANKDNWGNTILHYLAASCKRTEFRQATDILEEFGMPDIEAVNNEGLSALDVATAYRNDDMIKFLLQNI